MAVSYGTGAAGPVYFTEAEPARFRLSWKAIFAGTVVSLVTLLALNTLGLSIGLGVFDPSEPAGIVAIGIGAGIWMILSTIVSLFLGGCTAAWLSGITDPLKGMLHGIVMWGVVTLFSFYMMTSAVGMLLSGTAATLGQGFRSVTGIPGVAAPVMGQALPQDVQQDIRALVGRSARATPAIEQEINQAALALFVDPNITAADRTTVSNLLVSRLGISGTEALQSVDRWTASFERARATMGGVAATTVETMASTFSRAALWGFIMMVLGAASAAFGGWYSTPKASEVQATAVPRREEKAA